MTDALNSRRRPELRTLDTWGWHHVGRFVVHPYFDTFRTTYPPRPTLEHSTTISYTLLSRFLRASPMRRPSLGRHYSRCRQHGCRPTLGRLNPNNMARPLAEDGYSTTHRNTPSCYCTSGLAVGHPILSTNTSGSYPDLERPDLEEQLLRLLGSNLSIGQVRSCVPYWFYYRSPLTRCIEADCYMAPGDSPRL